MGEGYVIQEITKPHKVSRLVVQGINCYIPLLPNYFPMFVGDIEHDGGSVYFLYLSALRWCVITENSICKWFGSGSLFRQARVHVVC